MIKQFVIGATALALIAGCATTDSILEYKPVVDPELVNADYNKFMDASEKCVDLAIKEFEKDTSESEMKILGGTLGGGLLGWVLGVTRPPPPLDYSYVYSTGLLAFAGATLGGLGTAAGESLKGEDPKYQRIIDRCLEHEGYPVFTDLYREEF